MAVLILDKMSVFDKALLSDVDRAIVDNYIDIDQRIEVEIQKEMKQNDYLAGKIIFDTIERTNEAMILLFQSLTCQWCGSKFHPSKFYSNCKQCGAPK